MPGIQPGLHSEEHFYPGAHNGPDVSDLNKNSSEQRGANILLRVREHLTGSGFE